MNKFYNKNKIFLTLNKKYKSAIIKYKIYSKNINKK